MMRSRQVTAIREECSQAARRSGNLYLLKVASELQGRILVSPDGFIRYFMRAGRMPELRWYRGF